MYKSKSNGQMLTDNEYAEFVKRECEENGWDFDVVFDNPDSDFEYLEEGDE